MKKIFLFAAALALVACSSNDYLGNADLNQQQPKSDVMSFGFAKTNMYKAPAAEQTGATAANLLNSKFTVFGTKTVGSDTTNVFTNWVVNYVSNDAYNNESNSCGWDYVNSSLNQTVRYWDYAASKYDFQAWSTSDLAAADGTLTVTAHNPKLATEKPYLEVVASTPAALAKLYVADFKSVASSAYGQVVTLKFRNAATKVRLGIYETIEGYEVTNVTFRYHNSSSIATSSNAILDGSFNGVPASGSATYKVTYDDATFVPVFDNQMATTEVSKYFDFGTFNVSTSTPLGVGPSSDDSKVTWASGSPAYQIVLPNEDNHDAMTLWVDYTLTALDGHDVINVTGAHVTVPKDLMEWHPNYCYTYLFKISKNTNGTTGGPYIPGPDEDGDGEPDYYIDPTDPDNPIYPSDPEYPGTDPTNPQAPQGLYPITFDAVVVTAEDGTSQTIENEVTDKTQNVKSTSSDDLENLIEGLVTAGNTPNDGDNTNDVTITDVTDGDGNVTGQQINLPAGMANGFASVIRHIISDGNGVPNNADDAALNINVVVLTYKAADGKVTTHAFTRCGMKDATISFAADQLAHFMTVAAANGMPVTAAGLPQTGTVIKMTTISTIDNAVTATYDVKF